MSTEAITMFGPLFAQSSRDEFIDVRRIHPENGAVEEFVPATDIEAAASWAQARRAAGDVYVGVLPRTRRAGGRDAVPRGRVI